MCGFPKVSQPLQINCRQRILSNLTIKLIVKPCDKMCWLLVNGNVFHDDGKLLVFFIYPMIFFYQRSSAALSLSTLCSRLTILNMLRNQQMCIGMSLMCFNIILLKKILMCNPQLQFPIFMFKICYLMNNLLFKVPENKNKNSAVLKLKIRNYAFYLPFLSVNLQGLKKCFCFEIITYFFLSFI